ncbi:hypothetical protein D187_001740 [Cystobacter fuscus DSM 2262]|uniref:Uncharacterized protein n=1 Tax=Cystobacter fuscus (strain ATCC 25194 / DSM 2262 / NBRC 100088 / M29) TaxID=1242864 RepID=S9PBY6_CYSF2|nr:biotin/lipoyl-binding protein [Cystobacter fuscus]EPX60586.1 hypothetical protein D187_001740 [Cystobacter fuscus DSM 2262]
MTPPILSGTLQAHRIAAMLRAGQRVKKGQLLARLEDTALS